MTTYNKLRQILTDRLPHLKELSFGCEVKINRVIYKISPSKIKELKSIYGKCILTGEYQELEEESIVISFEDLVSDIQEAVISDETNFVINKQDKIFRTYSLCSNTSFGEIHCVSREEEKYRKILSKANTLFEDVAWGNNYFIKEIIGHQPTLQDVLLAIDIKNKGLETGYRTLGGGLDFQADMGLTYNLNKPLSQQSDETLLEIIKLIE